MKYYKEGWERKTPALTLSEQQLAELLADHFPGKKLEFFESVCSGLANTNIRFRFSGQNDHYLLRIYTHNQLALNHEILLSNKFANDIPMPEFIFIEHKKNGLTYAIQKWIEGKPLYTAFQNNSTADLSQIANDVAKKLSIIASQTFPKAGFFGKDFSIQPLDSQSDEHPFISYISDCLQKEHIKNSLGELAPEVIWQFILKNQMYFPPLEPACLVQGDFNPDNILIDNNATKVVGIIDWEFSFSGSYLFDIGNLLRCNIPPQFEEVFIESYQKYRNMQLPEHWKKMIRIQDISNLLGLLDTEHQCPKRVSNIKSLIQQTLTEYGS